jgi:hypothetical protein
MESHGQAARTDQPMLLASTLKPAALVSALAALMAHGRADGRLSSAHLLLLAQVLRSHGAIHHSTALGTSALRAHVVGVLR